MTGGPRREHEAIAANAIRWRRIENGEPCATYVLDAWRERQRIARMEWQRHYDEYMESVADERRVGMLTPLAAEQYANDMMNEENANSADD